MNKQKHLFLTSVSADTAVINKGNTMANAINGEVEESEDQEKTVEEMEEGTYHICLAIRHGFSFQHHQNE